jgi:hypothetical protein
MEFKLKDGVWVNGLGEVADIEDTCLFPLMKSSDVARESDAPMRRAMLVTQRRMQDDPADLADLAPRTWAYLLAHADMLAARKSSVYTGRPRFAMFGIGPYTFTDWKVAVSGMYKRLKFKAVGPVDGKPTVFDDTCYFLPAADAAEARKFADALNSPAAGEFFSAYVFPDAKRPINAKILGRLNLRALLDK